MILELLNNNFISALWGSPDDRLVKFTGSGGKSQAGATVDASDGVASHLIRCVFTLLSRADY